MTVYDLNKTRRTVRKFAQKPIDPALLHRMVDAARVSPSGANLQPLRYRIITEAADRAALFAHLKWAGYLPDGTPKADERPMAYVVVAQDEALRSSDAPYDAGAAIMVMNLIAHEAGVEACWIGSVDRRAVQAMYGMPETLRVVLVLALGYPAQEAHDVPVADGVKYWLDAEGVLNVPKRTFEDVLF